MKVRRGAVGQNGFAHMSFAPSESQTSATWRAAFRSVGTIRMMWARYVRRRRQLLELHELCAMDDMSLKDIGISRLEIRAAIRSGADLRSARH
jgi:uncharacterized protein YjiS (DUF1127 family)